MTFKSKAPYLILLIALLLLIVNVNAGLKDTHIPALVWKDVENSKIIFTSDDIIVFDWDRQVFRLKLNAALDFFVWGQRRLVREFLVQDESGTIYKAYWVNAFSSYIPTGLIYHPQSIVSYSTIFSIGEMKAGNPHSEEKDKRLLAGLKRAGVIHKLDPKRDRVDSRVKVISSSGYWKDCGNGLNVHVDFFEDTFRIGKTARAHVGFATWGKTLAGIDAIDIDIKLIANGGKFRSNCHIDNISPSVIHDGIYVCKFKPWQPLPGSAMNIEQGTGSVSLSVILKKKDLVVLKPTYRLDFDPLQVKIGDSYPR